LDSKATVLIISSEFARKQEFKLNKIKRSSYLFLQCFILVLSYWKFHSHFLYKTYRENIDWSNRWVEVDCDLENIMACLPQFWDWLENK